MSTCYTHNVHLIPNYIYLNNRKRFFLLDQFIRYFVYHSRKKKEQQQEYQNKRKNKKKKNQLKMITYLMV